MKPILFFFILCLLFSSFLDAVPYRLSLSGGSGGRTGQTVYTAPNGTVVTSSSPVYSNGNYYYMEYMFNQSYANGSHTDYWLPIASGSATLVFAFNQLYYVDSIRVYSANYTNSASSDRSSDYKLEGSMDGVNYTAITDGYVNTQQDLLGQYHSHTTQQSFLYVRLTALQNKSHISVNEVEFYVDSAPVPEMNSLLLMCISLLVLFSYKNF
ncbi:MAG: discoidin domain-containing protein [Candidatus Brocadiae bacterium]|nr:discoidin domain-containing protein [Candidatus Brocadiia bacterium]